MCFYEFYDSPVGRLTVASDENSIIGLWLVHQRFYMDVLQGQEYMKKETDVIRLTKTWLDKYFAGEKPEISELPIKFIGSDFRVEVWQVLTEIPYGKVKSFFHPFFTPDLEVFTPLGCTAHIYRYGKM